MRWRTKARIQRFVAYLPRGFSERVYYRIQRIAGAFRSIEPWEHLAAARLLADAAVRHGRPVAGAEILEVGTGHRLLLPMALWLLGAKRVTTVDVHRYLKGELVFEDVQQMARDPERVRAALSSSGASVEADRLEMLLRSPQQNLEKFLQDLGMDYRAPADAGALRDSAQAYDLHVSRSVLEHVPPTELARILVESKRVLRPSGLLVHLVDFSDHFAHVDSSIPSTHFLQFSDPEWNRLAGNQFAFHNRMRSDDFERLFRDNDLTLAESHLIVDERALKELENGFPIASRFQGRDRHRLAHREGLFVLRVRSGSSHGRPA